MIGVGHTCTTDTFLFNFVSPTDLEKNQLNIHDIHLHVMQYFCNLFETCMYLSLLVLSLRNATSYAIIHIQCTCRPVL